MLGIIFIMPIFQDVLKVKSPYLKPIIDLLLLSLAVQITLIPLLIFHFQTLLFLYFLQIITFYLLFSIKIKYNTQIIYVAEHFFDGMNRLFYPIRFFLDRLFQFHIDFIDFLIYYFHNLPFILVMLMFIILLFKYRVFT